MGLSVSAAADLSQVRKLVAGAQKLCSTEVTKAQEELDHGQTQVRLFRHSGIGCDCLQSNVRGVHGAF